ncbi:MAG: DUF1080 domain-containing protein, partial [Flavobacterium sp.]|nr:DUF1080 domain-containing protein [Flavobacterium sp.]
MKSKNQCRIGLFLVMILFFNLSVNSQNKKNQSKEKKQIVLFNETSTDAWKDIKSDNFPENGWVVKDGVLTVLPKTDKQEGGHDIITKEQFSNFELELEVRLSEGANSGVKYMVVDSYPGKKGQYLGLEYQLIDNENHADALLGRDGNRRMATLYDIYPVAGKLKINPPGKWNKVKIIVDGNHVEHWLNGKKAVEYTRDSDNYKEMV